MPEKKVWNEKMETLSREEVERVRIRRLRKQLKYCYTHSNFYRRKFDEVGFLPGDIKTWEDFRKIPPLMDKEEERKSQQESIERFGHPFGIHLCCSLEKIVVDVNNLHLKECETPAEHLSGWNDLLDHPLSCF